jgi:hypothetical protein
MTLTIFPGKNRDVKELVIQCQGETCYFPGFQPEVGSEAHGRAAFSL